MFDFFGKSTMRIDIHNDNRRELCRIANVTPRSCRLFPPPSPKDHTEPDAGKMVYSNRKPLHENGSSLNRPFLFKKRHAMSAISILQIWHTNCILRGKIFHQRQENQEAESRNHLPVLIFRRQERSDVFAKQATISDESKRDRSS